MAAVTILLPVYDITSYQDIQGQTPSHSTFKSPTCWQPRDWDQSLCSFTVWE